ncbi:MAG: hypothetical protein WC364_04925 [Eubacteriales bacterium]|jgi:hypothetical protein
MNAPMQGVLQAVPSAPIIPAIFLKALSRVSGRYYGMIGCTNYISSGVMVADKIYAMPFYVGVNESFDRIGVSVNTGSGNAHLGLYDDNGSGLPNSLLFDTGEISVSTGGLKESIISQALTPGLYWLAGLFSGTPSVFRPWNIIDLIGLGSISVFNGGSACFYLTSQAYGSLPNPHPAPSLASSSDLQPGICLRRV